MTCGVPGRRETHQLLFVTMRDRAWWQARGVYVTADDGNGLSPATSHPAFVAVAPTSFYEEADEFAPFGNDGGHDMLGALESWYLTGATDDDVPTFLVDTLADYGVPDGLWAAESSAARAWAVVADDTFVRATAQAAVAVAVGQFKIRGHVTSAVRRTGWQAVTLQRVFLEQARVRYPAWGRAGDATSGIDDVVRVLTSAPTDHMSK